MAVIQAPVANATYLVNGRTYTSGPDGRFTVTDPGDVLLLLRGGLTEYKPRSAPPVAPNAARTQVGLLQRAERTAQLVANRCDASQPQLSSGGSTSYSYRLAYTALSSFSNPQLVFSNNQVLSGGEVVNPDAYEAKALWETAGGVLIPAYFGGARTAINQPGGDLVSDPIPVRVNVGDRFFIRARPLVDTLGKKWPIGGPQLKGTVEGGGGNAGDVIDTAAPNTYVGTVVAFQPSAILGTHIGSLEATALLHGSSTIYGSTDLSTPQGDYGFAARACSLAGIPHVRMGVAGYTLSSFLGNTGFDTMANTAYFRRLIARTRPTFVFAQLSPNDVTAGASVAEVKARLTRYWDFLAGLGLPIIEATWHPLTTSANGWADTAGQATDGSDPVRQEINAWKLTKPHGGIVGVIDDAAIVQAPGNPSVYRADGGPWTTDGRHLNARGHTIVADEITGRLASLASEAANAI